jgi:heterodisulfide reductase subunit A
MRGKYLGNPHSPRFLNSPDMPHEIIVVGAGLAGMTATTALSELGHTVTLLEKENSPGGHVKNWDRLFPTLRPAEQVVRFAEKGLPGKANIIYKANISEISLQGSEFTVFLAERETVRGRAIVLATGFDLFDARKKEEYGYGIYDNVITSAELESLFRVEHKVVTPRGKEPRRIGIVHCVGSRDEKVGNLYCSKVCCVTGVKQAIEIKQALPDAEIYGFYMDLRMFDRYFEELYFEAQQKYGINFIRGRVSECAENEDHSILVKTEDTLTGRPLKMTVDLLVLLVGFTPSAETRRLAAMLGLKTGTDGFLAPMDEHTMDNHSSLPGVFLTGAVKGPTSIVSAIADARATALQVDNFLKSPR